MTAPDARSIVFGVVAASIAHRAGWSAIPLVLAVWWLVWPGWDWAGQTAREARQDRADLTRIERRTR